MCRTHTALDGTLLIVDNIPSVDRNSQWYGKTHYGMPIPEAVRSLYDLIGEDSQAFVFADQHYGLLDNNGTAEALLDRHFNEMMERAFGSNPPRFYVELGWPRLYSYSRKGIYRSPRPTGLYGHERRRALNTEETPTLITLFSEFYWNDFYDEICARTTPTSRYEEHDITAAQLLRGVVRTLQTNLGVIRFNKTMEGVPPNLETLLKNATLASKHYQRVALITWSDSHPVISTIVTVDQYSGPTRCSCGDLNCSNPDCTSSPQQT